MLIPLIEFIKLSGVLCAITLIASLLLACVNKITLPRIVKAEEQAAVDAMRTILSDANAFKELDEGVFEAKKNDETIGYCINVSSAGFGGNISMIVGIGTDDKVKGIEILSHSETAGLGAKATTPDFKNRFKEKNININIVKNETESPDEVQTITGATITSRAVAKGVSDAYAKLQSVKGGNK